MQKVKIDEHGQLLIDRNGKMVNAKCPYRYPAANSFGSISMANCDHYCPLLYIEEQVETIIIGFGCSPDGSAGYEIEREDFIDERR